MKKLIVVLLVFIGFTLWSEETIEGMWLIKDSPKREYNTLVLLYKYDGYMYGRILALLDKKTNDVVDDVDIKQILAQRFVNNPPICGVDFVYQLVEDKGRWVGSILDPQFGDEYDCIIKRSGEDITVRGQLKSLGFLGRSETWRSVTEDDLPVNLRTINTNTLIPVKLVKKRSKDE